ncbi:cytochrome c biogenesis protein DipZ [Pseudolysinimonas yzui]|uniref:Protein DipZ n=1 Tax=Pseudolysinimonas yzui TaxID=2708254 RepID=A0A8J3GRW2_9MICO|nr:cytochrome c biogenesis protein DipZ [Pseudolysinimonas yzui]GHF19899.1 protein DipZ [Pseudolysinimonas yzui]
MDITLILIGLLGGLITGISPCILPVLPVIFLSGGAASARNGESGEVRRPSRWRPFLVIAGLALSFSVVTLVGSLLLALLGLPQDVLRWAGIVVLTLIGIGLIVPRFQHLLELPFSKIPQKYVSPDRNGFLLGLALGAVFVPCAGPVLAAITVAGSTGRIGVDTVALTASFAIGTSVPLLVFALAGRGVAERIKAFRRRQGVIRVIGGVTMLALAIGLVFNLPALLQRLIPDYTGGIQEQLAESDQVQDALDLGGLVNEQNKDLDQCSNGGTELESCGTAPDIRGITAWLNTPGGAGVDLDDLRGQVVLIDFWTYACINCQRSLPHVTAWDEAYRDAGLQVIGIHSPEYAFEKEQRNVEQGIANFGIEYPVAMDNNLSTWTNYRNRYWPATYLIDAQGVVRHIKFGEGGYDDTERLIRELLRDADPDVVLPGATDLTDETPEVGATTPETYLSAGKVVNFGGDERYTTGPGSYEYPTSLDRDTFALDGDWTIDFQGATPTAGEARVRLAYTATQEVRVVLGGTGTVIALVDGERVEVDVAGSPDSYRLLDVTGSQTGQVDLTVPAGVTVYSFTFG